VSGLLASGPGRIQRRGRRADHIESLGHRCRMATLRRTCASLPLPSRAAA